MIVVRALLVVMVLSGVVAVWRTPRAGRRRLWRGDQ